MFINNSNLNARCSTRVDLLEEMGSSPTKKSASTGTMTRIVKGASKKVSTTMEQTRASKKIFLQACLFLITFVSLTLFAFQMVAFRSTIMLLYSNVRVSLKNVMDVCVKFSLLTT